MKITREELQAIENHMSNIPAVAGMYTPVLIAWCHALLNDNDNAYQRGAEARAYTIGETEWAQRIATLEHMLAEERENVDTLRARVAELEAEVAVLEPRSVMLKRAHGALTDAGCVVPLEFDKSIEHAIKDLARRATRAEQLFVDEYDARLAVERDRDDLQARIAVLEAMKP